MQLVIAQMLKSSYDTRVGIDIN